MNSHLLDKAIQYDKGDPRRIQHFLKVHEFAVLIVQDLQRHGVAMEHLDAFGEWVEAYAYLL